MLCQMFHSVISLASLGVIFPVAKVICIGEGRLTRYRKFAAFDQLPKAVLMQGITYESMSSRHAKIRRYLGYR